MRDISPGDIIFEQVDFRSRLVGGLHETEETIEKLLEEINHIRSTLPSMLHSTAPYHRSFPVRMAIAQKRVRAFNAKSLEEFYVGQLEERGCTVGDEALPQSGELFEYGE